MLLVFVFFSAIVKYIIYIIIQTNNDTDKIKTKDKRLNIFIVNEYDST